MNAQLSADVTMLKAASQRVKMTIGADRYHAAQAAMAEERCGNQTSSPLSAHGSFATDEAEDVLALARRVGLTANSGRLVASSDEASMPASLTAAEQADVAILRKAGILKASGS